MNDADLQLSTPTSWRRCVPRAGVSARFRRGSGFGVLGGLDRL